MRQTNRRRARIGESRSQVGDDAERFLQGADSEESGIGDKRAAVEGDLKLLRAEVPEAKVWLP